MRPIQEILKDIYATNDLQKLIDLWNEIAINKRCYSLDEIHLANKEIRRFSLTSNGSDIQKGSFYMALSAQIS